ncbi:VPLPA-CTERM sorting domain-containing protein [Rubrimonas cliftonensis]|uniref:VPLPA-CTERM protein sorting domain-containing protein n=1 Tax=Rubrimonas cliftonensis TaxID=89524 RepID=A0A1H4AI57_9RHOB|nr:VPLPA-CTERM sorting domain-containing protein [Rubrimonas cliftonensis]SEA35699.1 VPLPA-CTERM protein sorting domain-containing protein [Rubrimonas cliftonensis]
MRRAVLIVGFATGLAASAQAATVASTQFGRLGPRITDPAAVNETFVSLDGSARGQGRADAASLGVLLDLDPFTSGIVDAAIFERLFYVIIQSGPAAGVVSQPATVALSGRLTGDIEEIDPATGLPRPAGQSTFGNLRIGVESFRDEAERVAVRQREAAGPNGFVTDLTGPIGGGAGVAFGVTPGTRSLFTPTPTAAVCDALCQDVIRRNPNRGADAPDALAGAFSLGFALVASSDGDSLGPATLSALTSLEIDGLILLDAAGDPIPAFVFSETRDYTVAAFAPDIAPIPLPAAAPLLLAGLAALTLLRRARRI